MFNDDILPNGDKFPFWEKPLVFKKTYYVDCKDPNASDDGPGTKDKPFRTIGAFARIAEPGQRVIIREGVYRECIRPEEGGAGPEEMISYESAEGEKVTVKGSVILRGGWKKSEGWALRKGGVVQRIDIRTNTWYSVRLPEIVGKPRIWEIELDGDLFKGYNPFGMLNIMHDRTFLSFDNPDIKYFFLRRGMVFVDGKPLQQVEHYEELGWGDGCFWVEHNGMVIHLRLPNDDDPKNHIIEITTKEQVFAPAKRYLGYIRIKGINFEHAANGYPPPQRGLISANRGHHWIIEDNVVQWGNSLGIDLGNECWHASPPPSDNFGNHVVRGNIIRYCGIGGLEAMGAPNLLVEDNLIEYCGITDLGAESGGVKFHGARNLLFRRNVIRHGRGLWLDCFNENCRITNNIFADIVSAFGAIHFEMTKRPNQIDNNIIWGVKVWEAATWRGLGGCGLLSNGSDKIIFVNNLVAKCENTGFKGTAYQWQRIAEGTNAIVKGNRIYNNIFYDCQVAIELDDPQNEIDGNLYFMPRIWREIQGGFIRFSFPEPPEWLDVEGAREYYCLEKNGAAWDLGSINIEFDPETLTISLDVKKEPNKVPIFNKISVGWNGERTEEDKRYPGPFIDLMRKRDKECIDPRKISK